MSKGLTFSQTASTLTFAMQGSESPFSNLQTHTALQPKQGTLKKRLRFNLNKKAGYSSLINKV